MDERREVRTLRKSVVSIRENDTSYKFYDNYSGKQVMTMQKFGKRFNCSQEEAKALQKIKQAYTSYIRSFNLRKRRMSHEER